MTLGYLADNLDQLVQQRKIFPIRNGYYYIPVDNGNESYVKTEDDYNFFHIIRKYKNIDIQPVTLFQMLTDLSDKVPFGNNFSNVVLCLNIPEAMRRMARDIDKQLAEMVC